MRNPLPLICRGYGPALLPALSDTRFGSQLVDLADRLVGGILGITQNPLSLFSGIVDHLSRRSSDALPLLRQPGLQLLYLHILYDSI